MPVAGAPFTAVESETTTTPAGVAVFSIVIARRSEGSTYYAPRLISSTYPKPTAPRLVTFNDLKGHKTYTVHPDLGSYGSRTTDLKTTVWQVQSAADYMKQAGGPGAKRMLGQIEETTVGIRQIEGIDTVDILDTYQSGRTFEKWYSPALDLNIQTKDHVSGVEDRETKVEQIRVGEPDAKLFVVPQGYTVEAPPGHALVAPRKTAQ